MSGATALEAFHCTKGDLDYSRERGRADLYIATCEWSAEIEAKQEFINGSSDQNRISVVASRVLENARKDIISANRNHMTRYACAFLPIWYPKVERPSEGTLSRLRNTLTNVQEIDILAWCFPVCARGFLEDNLYYPGITVALRKIK